MLSLRNLSLISFQRYRDMTQVILKLLQPMKFQPFISSSKMDEGLSENVIELCAAGGRDKEYVVRD